MQTFCDGTRTSATRADGAGLAGGAGLARGGVAAAGSAAGAAAGATSTLFSQPSARALETTAPNVRTNETVSRKRIVHTLATGTARRQERADHFGQCMLQPPRPLHAFCPWHAFWSVLQPPLPLH